MYRTFVITLSNPVTNNSQTIQFGENTTVKDIMTVTAEEHNDLLADGGMVRIAKMGFMEAKTKKKLEEMIKEFSEN